jgi:FKBP-type peptidyl-prolyl cis-trans isomerase
MMLSTKLSVACLRSWFSQVLLVLMCLVAQSQSAFASNSGVRVETVTPGTGPPVTRDSRYRSMVTLYIVGDDEQLTPSGWSTRQEHGSDVDKPFEFQPGVNLIEGWTEGVLQMLEGERAKVFVPFNLGYGNVPMGSKNGGGFYIPANSNLMFDIQILGKAGGESTEL